MFLLKAAEIRIRGNGGVMGCRKKQIIPLNRTSHLLSVLSGIAAIYGSIQRTFIVVGLPKSLYQAARSS